MYQRILVPLDGSERAERILPHVETLASKGNSTVILLYVIEPAAPSFTPGMSMMVTPPPQELEIFWKNLQEAEKQAEEYLKKQAAILEKKGIKTEALLQRGDPVNAIVNMASETNADLIAMTSHGRTGLERVFYGSVTSGVLHKVDRPLLLIRAQK
ncbi:MAG: universal stress protein [Anaerolineales bacterium]